MVVVLALVILKRSQLAIKNAVTSHYVFIECQVLLHNSNLFRYKKNNCDEKKTICGAKNAKFTRTHFTETEKDEAYKTLKCSAHFMFSRSIKFHIFAYNML